jgi:MFS family permease
MNLGWFSELKQNERTTYWACFWGYALESMDAQMFALVIPALIEYLGINRGTAGTIGTAALVGGLIGGPLGGLMADRVGRIRVLQLTILWVSLWTFASAFADSSTQLIAARFLQGIGYGAESAVGAVLISEAIVPRLRGRIASSIQSAYAVGYAMAVGIMPIVFMMFDGPIAWRVLFAIGIMPMFFIFYIRRFVPESPIYAARADAEGKRRTRSREIFQQPYLRRTILATLQAMGTLGAAYVSIIWLPTYLRTVTHLAVASTAGFLFINISGSFVGPFVYGMLSDRLGRRRGVQIFLVCQAINMSTFTMAPIGPQLTLVLAFLQGGLQAGLASAMLPAFAELFPTRIRGAGQGFCLSGGRGLGSVVPTAVGYLSLTLPLGYAMGLCALGGYVLAFIAVCLLPETSGVDLREDPATGDTPLAVAPI